MEKLNPNTLKKEIIKNSKEIFQKHPEEKYRKDFPEFKIRFPIKNYIELKVYSKALKKEIQLATFMQLPDIPVPKAIIFMFHGMGSYSELSAFIAKSFAEIGCITVAYDYRGHGCSEGVNGTVEDFAYAIEDSKQFIKETEEYLITKFNKNTEFLQNKFLCGISMGGLMCYILSKEKQSNFKGSIMFSPAVGFQGNWIKRTILKLIGSCCPQSVFPIDKKESLMCKNPGAPDPIYIDTKVKFQQVKNILNYIEKCEKELKEYEAPFVIIIPGVDKLIPPLQMFEFYEGSKSKDKDVWYYENCWHAIYIEEEIFGILKRLHCWIEERL